LPFDPEERASKNQKQNTVTFQRGALMRYSLVIKTLLMCQQHLKNFLTYRI